MQKISYLFTGSLISSLFFSTLFSQDNAFHKLVFVKEALTHITTVGAIAPFSKQTADAITKHIHTYANQHQTHLRVLELGAGTGTLSKNILTALKETRLSYELDLIEIMPEYADSLKDQFTVHDNVKIYCEDAQTFRRKDGKKYDVVISTLPFNALDFNSKLVTNILHNIESITKSNGRFIWVEYALLTKLMEKCLFGTKYIEHVKKIDIKDKFLEDHGIKALELVAQNVPPTWVIVQSIK